MSKKISAPRRKAGLRVRTEPFDDSPEWTAADFARAKRPSEILPADLVEVIAKRKPGERGPQKAPTKELISIRLDKDVLEHFRNTGRGWQVRVNEFLRLGVMGMKGAGSKEK
jgi:uncharacterized protein (DUF4415 family)